MSKFTWKDIYDASLNLLFPLNLEETYKVAVEEAMKLLTASEGTLLRDINGKLTRVYATKEELLNSYVSQTGRTKKALDSKEPFVEQITSQKQMHNDIKNIPAKSIVFIPLTYENNVIGVLNVLFTQRDTFTDEQLFMLKFFGSMISQAIYKAEEYKKAEDAILVRDLFIAMASHELKTPLTSISLYAEMIKRQADKKQQPSPMFVDNLLKQTKWLTKLTNDLLQVNSIRQKKLHYTKEKINIADVIEAAMTAFKMSYANYEVKYVSTVKPEDLFILGDHYKLLQVITNILNNAVKFSPEHSTVTIKISSANKKIKIDISDQGEGIQKKDLPKIFEGFYKGGGQKKHEGMGLGLFLVKEIIDHHDGEISVSSEIKKGTTVHIVLPQYSL